MASITRIQVANYLSDGYVNGMEWMPLYRGETLRLFGQSAALQIDNGGGKTSLTEACLYLLSQDRRLKKRVEERVSPLDKGWSHIRIEFVEKPQENNVAQAFLITALPDEVPGTPYVIGLCWNRGKDPYFYHYQGLLEDAECFQKTESKLELIDNATFKKSVEKIPGARWNTWRNIAEWHDDIRQFTNVEVIKQNVEFQIEGAGDYSAMVTRVKPQNGESYDVAFFRQCVAPELLKQPLGDEGGAHEQKFEDALFSTLKPTADALVDINRKQQELNDATDAINKFQPVEEKAQEIIQADSEYNSELAKVVQEAAIIHAIAVKNPIPGIPVLPANPQWIKDKKVLEALSHLVIDKREGILITDEGLAKLSGIEVKRINEKAADGKIQTVPSSSQLIELKGDLKNYQNEKGGLSNLEEAAQLVELKGDLKKEARGGRRYVTNCFPLDSALALLSASANIAGAHTEGLKDVLTRAFGIAITELDTNPYRLAKRKLSSEREEFRQTQKTAKANLTHWQTKYEELLSASRETQENQVAYENFAARKQDFPEEYWEVPLRAQEWAVKAREGSQKEHTDHIKRVGTLSNDFNLWNKLKSKHGLITLPLALDDLNNVFGATHEQDKNAKQALTNARENHRQLSSQFAEKYSKLETFNGQRNILSKLAVSLPKFHEIFGDAEPETLNPQKSLKEANQSLASKETELNKANTTKSVLDALIPQVAIFQNIFGEVDPFTLNPTKSLTDHKDKISTEQRIMDGELSYVEALNIFQDTNPNQTPDEWLKWVVDSRNNLGNEKRENENRIKELRQELADFEKFAVADNRVYASALDALQVAGMVFERLHEVITKTTTGNRREQLLTLFSGALSAPVVSSVEDADQATNILEMERLTVPVFFKPTLLEFIQQGEIKIGGPIAYTILVGRHTRQVEILLNPSLIEEEKSRIITEDRKLTSRNQEIDTELALVSEESPSVKQAVSAKDAIKRDSIKIFNVAEIQIKQLHANMAEYELRASSKAINSIEAMKQYRNAGGEKNYHELIDIVIPRLVGEKKTIEDRIETLNSQVTEEANRALHATKDYKKLGGDKELDRLTQDIQILEPEVEVLKSQVEEIGTKIREVLEDASEEWAQKMVTLNQTYSIDKQQLETAIAFENAGNVQFMQQESSVRQKLNEDVELAQRRLENIDFQRAHSYIQAAGAEERSIADQLAEAERERDQAKIREEEAQRQADHLSGQISDLIPFVEALHEMVVAIRTQHNKIAHFSDDIRQRMQMDGAVHPEILAYAEQLGLACLGGRASTSEETHAAIANLKVEIEELEIDTKHLLSLSKACAKTRNEFEERRREFCDKVRKNEIKGLHTLEIEAIEKAKTLEELESVHALKGKIEAQIREHEANLQVFKNTMESNRSATVDSLARFARNAKINLATLEKVMKRNPNARFIVKAEMASEERIHQIIESLIAEIEDREKAARERSSATLNSDIDYRNKSYKDLINAKIYHDIFIDPKVTFIHTAIRDGETPLTAPGTGLSTGQHTALAMMWLVRQAEYAQARVVAMSGTRKEQRAAMKGSHRIMFFDGLFSNLSNESYINAAFQGLKDVGDNFQLIGLIHNPYYVNNKDIFPAHLVGKRKLAKSNDKERVFVAVEPWQEDNGMILYTSAYKHNPSNEHAET